MKTCTCKKCGRIILGKRRLGRCPNCFANHIDFLLILFGIPLACMLYIISPVDFAPEGFLGWIGFTDDGLIVTIGIIIQIILIVRMVGRKKAL